MITRIIEITAKLQIDLTNMSLQSALEQWSSEAEIVVKDEMLGKARINNFDIIKVIDTYNRTVPLCDKEWSDGA